MIKFLSKSNAAQEGRSRGRKAPGLPESLAKD